MNEFQKPNYVGSATYHWREVVQTMFPEHRNPTAIKSETQHINQKEVLRRQWSLRIIAFCVSVAITVLLTFLLKH